MFGGPDAQLVQDALIIGALALAAGIGLGLGALRLRVSKVSRRTFSQEKSNLEERVQVLERIATDRSIDLADEIDALRTPKETV